MRTALCSNAAPSLFAKQFGILCICAVLLVGGGCAYAAEQYKLIARDAMADIVDGKIDNAVKTAEKYLRKNPDDLESMYVLAVVCAQRGQLDAAMEHVRRAVAGGLPLERFVAGPRDLLAPLTESNAFQEAVKEHQVVFLHGPMVGCVTQSSAKLWVRTAEETDVWVRVHKADDQARLVAGARARTHEGQDFTAVLAVDGLEPATAYEYEISAGGSPAVLRGSFHTFGPAREGCTFSIGFGGGAGYTPQHERMWNTVASHKLAAFLFLGDNVYIDNPTKPAVQRYCYYRRQSRPEFRAFTASTPIYAIWDDHDFTVNDGWGGRQIADPPWKVPVWRLFKENWVNPYYGGGEEQPGCWFDFSIGDVDFFMLDGRFYRDKGRRQGVKVEDPSVLGAAQKKWLLEKLEASKGTFKVLASPVPWAPGAKPGQAGMDTWEGFHEERDEIFDFLARHEIEGVILISADRHRSDAWKIERKNGYPLYEFESSRLTNVHTHSVMKKALFGYNKKCSFGKLSFDTTLADPKVTYRIINIDGEVVYTLSLKRGQLAHN